MGLPEKATPGHRTFSAGAAGDIRELVERKAAHPSVAGCGVLLHLDRPDLPYGLWDDSRPRLPVAVACAGLPCQCDRLGVGNRDLQTARHRKKAHRRVTGETDVKTK